MREFLKIILPESFERFFKRLSQSSIYDFRETFSEIFFDFLFDFLRPEWESSKKSLNVYLIPEGFWHNVHSDFVNLLRLEKSCLERVNYTRLFIKRTMICMRFIRRRKKYVMRDTFNRKLKVTCLSCFGSVLSWERQNGAFCRIGRTKCVLLFSSLAPTDWRLDIGEN